MINLDIENIILNDNLSISEKLKELDKLLKSYEKEIKNKKIELLKEYRYCPNCKDYYKKYFWKEGTQSFTYKVCRQNNIYVEKTKTQNYIECPKEHKIFDIYDC